MHFHLARSEDVTCQYRVPSGRTPDPAFGTASRACSSRRYQKISRSASSIVPRTSAPMASGRRASVGSFFRSFATRNRLSRLKLPPGTCLPARDQTWIKASLDSHAEKRRGSLPALDHVARASCPLMASSRRSPASTPRFRRRRARRDRRELAPIGPRRPAGAGVQLAPMPMPLRWSPAPPALGSEVTKLTETEPGVERGPDDEPLGKRLADIRQTIRFFGGEPFSHGLIPHLSVSNSRVPGFSNTQPLRFPTGGLPAPQGARKWPPPEKTRGLLLRAVSGVGSRSG